MVPGPQDFWIPLSEGGWKGPLSDREIWPCKAPTYKPSSTSRTSPLSTLIEQKGSLSGWAVDLQVSTAPCSSWVWEKSYASPVAGAVCFQRTTGCTSFLPVPLDCSIWGCWFHPPTSKTNFQNRPFISKVLLSLSSSWILHWFISILNSKALQFIITVFNPALYCFHDSFHGERFNFACKTETKMWNSGQVKRKVK